MWMSVWRIMVVVNRSVWIRKVPSPVYVNQDTDLPPTIGGVSVSTKSPNPYNSESPPTTKPQQVALPPNSNNMYPTIYAKQQEVYLQVPRPTQLTSTPLSNSNSKYHLTTTSTQLPYPNNKYPITSTTANNWTHANPLKLYIFMKYHLDIQDSIQYIVLQ